MFDGALARRGSNLLLQLLHAAIHGGDARARAYRDAFTASPANTECEGAAEWSQEALLSLSRIELKLDAVAGGVVEEQLVEIE